MTNTKILLSKRQAAEALSVSVRTVDYLIANKKLKVTRIGRRVLVPTKALEQFARNTSASRSMQ